MVNLQSEFLHDPIVWNAGPTRARGRERIIRQLQMDYSESVNVVAAAWHNGVIGASVLGVVSVAGRRA